MATETSPAAFRLIAEVGHQFTAMPFYPADFVRRQFAAPAFDTRGTYRAKLLFGSRVTAPALACFCRHQHDVGAKLNLQKTAHSLHGRSRITHQILVAGDESRQLACFGPQR